MPDKQAPAANQARGILFCPTASNADLLQEALEAARGDRPLWIWPDVPSPEKVACLVAFRPPPGVFEGLAALRLVHGVGAGVNALRDAPGRPAGVPLCRVVAEELDQGMAQHIIHAILRETRDHRLYDEQQRARIWKRLTQRHACDITVGIMGLGALGLATARPLRQLGYNLVGWSRSRKSAEGIESFAGPAEMGTFLSRSDFLVVLLPITAETHGILDATALSKLPRGAVVVAVGRGGQVDEAALLAALDSGHLSHAHLDVFETEPLPADSALWAHPGVTLTPHIAASPHPLAVARLVMENLSRIERGEPPLHAVDEARGY
ncbi:2-hydroxyacid dehydrogenase [Pararoseomonas indoligenes]|nr:glyoxylate/hydroxypyruvate reductase A [Pararoseomonas indoligenes]